MKRANVFVVMIIVGVLLAVCGLSLDNFRAKRCEERGGEWKSVNGTVQCVMPR